MKQSRLLDLNGSVKCIRKENLNRRQNAGEGTGVEQGYRVGKHRL